MLATSASPRNLSPERESEWPGWRGESAVSLKWSGTGCAERRSLPTKPEGGEGVGGSGERTFQAKALRAEWAQSAQEQGEPCGPSRAEGWVTDGARKVGDGADPQALWPSKAFGFASE